MAWKVLGTRGNAYDYKYQVNMAFVSPNNAEKGGGCGVRCLFGLFLAAEVYRGGGRRLGGGIGTGIFRQHPFSGSAKATAGVLLKQIIPDNLGRGVFPVLF